MKKILITLISIITVYLLLLIPCPEQQLPASPGKKAFIWDKDALWNDMEKKFIEVKDTPCKYLERDISSSLYNYNLLLQIFDNKKFEYSNSVFKIMEYEFFNLAPMIAACPERLNDYIELAVNVRKKLKEQSKYWDMSDSKVKHLTYRLLYGTRAAIEEVMLQNTDKEINKLTLCNDEPSQTPFTELLGVKIHSGDILVSRGGAPTSALISRGSDYPGNFSHVALAHVDKKTNKLSIIEAHIEVGVAIADADKYIKDTKLRVMVLRLRSDHPELIKDPMLPHKAAEYALKDAQTRHIPYDFAMDYTDDNELFCSEVASYAYRKFNIDLWMKLSSISQPGLMNWLGAFGVRNFETQEPSDLEYDPQLTVVAEWRDLNVLFKDHIDNAILDVRLEGANNGDQLTYPAFLLPFGRIMKAYSWVSNIFGQAGAVPEGMSAESALKNDSFSKTHAKIKSKLLPMLEEFEKENGYRPPYWKIVEMAREAVK
ncbi:MAG: hypothetical protein JXR69_00250 [Candidatus Delongbacteria bacterium]|nr:hypothetical protein [Candidatus Delongbacteria bacterium]